MADDEVDALYGLPLGEFVPARNALAKELEQPEIKKLQKPSTTAWVLNQLVRQAPDDVEALLAAGHKVAETQAGAVRGRGSAPFREAVHAEREALTPLLARARRLVKGEPQMLKVADALRAAAAHPALHEPLRAGRLSEGPETGGFGGLDGLDAPVGAGNEAEEQAARAARERRDLEKAAERAEREAARLEERAEQAERRATDLRAQADDARRAADDAAARLDALP